ncbi:MAG: hypothetical protein GY906_38375 [bacterium]|nr:hypothetical protein [bacterium]
MALAKVVHIMPIEKGFRGRTKGRLNLRFTYAKENIKSQATRRGCRGSIAMLSLVFFFRSDLDDLFVQQHQ